MNAHSSRCLPTCCLSPAHICMSWCTAQVLARPCALVLPLPAGRPQQMTASCSNPDDLRRPGCSSPTSSSLLLSVACTHQYNCTVLALVFGPLEPCAEPTCYTYYQIRRSATTGDVVCRNVRGYLGQQLTCWWHNSQAFMTWPPNPGSCRCLHETTYQGCLPFHDAHASCVLQHDMSCRTSPTPNPGYKLCGVLQSTSLPS
jgi:hypothetical protein